MKNDPLWTENGCFFTVKVQGKFNEYGIKFRPDKPASAHLNGKIERSKRQTRLSVTLPWISYNDLNDLLAQEQNYKLELELRKLKRCL